MEVRAFERLFSEIEENGSIQFLADIEKIKFDFQRIINILIKFEKSYIYSNRINLQ